MALYTNDSKERVRDAVDMVDLVSSRVELKRAGANRLTGLCPFHDERTPVVRDQPRREGLPLLRLPGVGRRVHVRHGDRGRGLQGRAGAPRRPLQGRRSSSRTRTRRPPSGASAASGCWSCWSARRRTTCACSGSPRRRRKAREYLAGRGLEEGTLREFRVGYAPSAWDTVLNASRRAGLRQPRALRRRPRAEVAGQRPHLRPLPLADHLPARRRARPGAAASPGARWAATPATGARSTSTAPRASCFTRAARCSPPISLARPAAKAQSVIAAEGYTDVLAMHQAGMRNCVGDHGHRADRGADRRARAPGAGGQARAGRRQRGPGRDAARRAGGGRPQAAAAPARRRRCRRATIPPTSCSARAARRSSGWSRRAVPFARFRVLRRAGHRRPGDAPGPRPRARRAARATSRCCRPAPSARSCADRASRLDLSPELLESLLARSGRTARPPRRRGRTPAPMRGR